MSLIRQIWLLLLGTLLLAFVAGVTVNVTGARDALQTQLSLQNSDNATALAQVMTQQKGQRELMELAATAQFDTGYYQRIRLTGVDGKPLFLREAASKPLRAPAWFATLVPIASVPGTAQVSDGWRAIGTLEVVSQVAYAHDQLWRSSVRSALALALVGLVAGALAHVGVRRIRRPLTATVAQAESLQRGEYLRVPEPSVPELRRLTVAMNSMVDRLRGVFESQAEQVEALRRQAGGDALTGLANRAHFLAQLNASLQREDGSIAGGLVLLRVLDLAELNRRLGRPGADRLIAAIAQTLHTYTERVRGAFAGRLYGSDFALALPLGGVAAESARAVVELLRSALPGLDAGAAVAAGAIETRHRAVLAELMATADLALARAESAGPFSVEAGDAADAPWLLLGERGWRERVREALVAGRVRLAPYPVVDAQGRLIHLECPLRMQLEEDGRFEAAAYWLPLAMRSRLTSEVDERALALALEDNAHDGQPRSINLSPASLADSGFAARLRAALQAMPREARLVWIEITEAAAVEHFDLVRELGRQLRPTGARFGLEHAGEHLGEIERLFEAGLDYVKLDAAVAHGVALDATRAGFVKSLVTLLHSLAIQVYVEGVNDERDARALHALGVDGLTGPGVETPAGAPARV
jgi:EAL domain-containing protein (putative c-di-GMP-specific phosphodiesterase class I)/GGDEF domain-containing protein